MPRSLILRTVSLGLLYVIVLFSFFIFAIGHNSPGGGFVAGLIASAMILIQFMAFSRRDLTRTFRPVFLRFVGFGLLLSGGSGFFGILAGTAYLDGFHWSLTLLGESDRTVASVMIFDLGIYFVVIGTVVSIFMALEEKRS